MLRSGKQDDEIVKSGSLVIVYERHDSMRAVYVDESKDHNNRFGSFPMKDWVGKPYGSVVRAKHDGGWVALLRPTAELWSVTLKHRTQIIYAADIALACMMMELKPGSIVLETGTGTGSLTTSLARCVAPTGHVHTFEFHEGRANAARDDFARNGLAHCITVEHRNTIKDGFPEHLHGMADAVFLDLPFPAPVVASAAKCLRPNGVLCSFSPCIEQVLRTSEEMAKLEMLHVTTYEFLLRLYDVGLYPINKLPPMEDNVAQGKAAGEPDDADEQDAAEDAAVEQQEGAAEDGDVEETPTRKPVLPAKRKAGQKQGRKGEHGQLFQAHSLARTVVARPTMAAKGHTGFLTFCRTQPA